MDVELKPIKTKKIYEEIVEQIKELIMEGQLKSGDRLPSERMLVESFRVSRASIREALSALEMMGLLEVRTGEGAYIRNLQTDSMAQSLTWALSMEKGTVLELFEVRKMIEVQAVGYAAERATEEEIIQLENVLQNMKSNLLHIGEIGEKADHAFHYKISRLTHNRITMRLMDSISDHLQHMLRASRDKLYEGNYTPELLYEEHVKIFEVIKKRDRSRAREEMLNHLSNVEKEIIKLF